MCRVQGAIGSRGFHLFAKRPSVASDGRIASRALTHEHDAILGEVLLDHVGNKATIEDERHLVERVQPVRRVQISVGQQMKLAGVQYAFLPAAQAVSPSEPNRPRTGARRGTYTGGCSPAQDRSTAR